MTEFGDIRSAGRMRDVIERISTQVVNRLRPDVRIGQVHHFNPDTQIAWIKFVGSEDDDLVQVRAAYNMTPLRSIESHSELIADIVRVAGRPGAYYVTDYVRGGPRACGSVPALHYNADFQLDSQGALPTSWTGFWSTGGITINLDTTVHVTGKQSVKIVIPAGAGNNVAFQDLTVFSVTPGEVNEFGCVAKSNNPQGRVVIELLLAPTGGNPQYFDPGLSIMTLGSYLPGTIQFAELIGKAKIPAGYNIARIVFRCSIADGTAGTIWLDTTTSKSHGDQINPEPGEWITYVPSLGNVTLGASTKVGRYTRIQDTIVFTVVVTLGAGFAVTGPPVVGLPVAGVSGFGVADITFNDVGSNAYKGMSNWSTTTLIGYAGGGAGGAFSGVNATSPFTWAVGDNMQFAGTYEAIP
jgi:hypothetical protein